MMFLASLVAQTTYYDSDFVCLDSADGITFWGIERQESGGQYFYDWRVLKFLFVMDGFEILEEIDLPDSLTYKKIIAINDERFVIQTSDGRLITYQEQLFYYGDVTGYVDIKRVSGSIDSFYALHTSSVTQLSLIPSIIGGYWLGSCDTMDDAKCFEIDSYNYFVIGGSYNSMATLAIFTHLHSNPITFINSTYLRVNSVYINGPNSLIVLCIQHYQQGQQSFDLIRYNNNGESQILHEWFSTSTTKIIMAGHNNCVYVGHLNSVIKYDLSSGAFETVASSDGEYGNLVSQVSIVGNKLITLFSHGDIVIYEMENTSVDDEVSVPQIELSNYPNPFNQSTTISFNMPKSGMVDVSIFNIKGQLVKTLVNSQKSSSVNNVVWDGTDDNGNRVTEGVYFYKVRCGSCSTTGKMVFLK